jgi:hypothetical protein
MPAMRELRRCCRPGPCSCFVDALEFTYVWQSFLDPNDLKLELQVEKLLGLPAAWL